jgi:hypothetical protein
VESAKAPPSYGEHTNDAVFSNLYTGVDTSVYMTPAGAESRTPALQSRSASYENLASLNDVASSTDTQLSANTLASRLSSIGDFSMTPMHPDRASRIRGSVSPPQAQGSLEPLTEGQATPRFSSSFPRVDPLAVGLAVARGRPSRPYNPHNPEFRPVGLRRDSEELAPGTTLVPTLNYPEDISRVPSYNTATRVTPRVHDATQAGLPTYQSTFRSETQGPEGLLPAEAEHVDEGFVVGTHAGRVERRGSGMLLPIVRGIVSGSGSESANRSGGGTVNVDGNATRSGGRSTLGGLLNRMRGGGEQATRVDDEMANLRLRQSRGQ